MRQKLARRTILAGIAVVAPALISVTVVAPAATAARLAAATPVKFTGTITCSVSGKITANPPITFTTATSKITLTATLSKCSGNKVEKSVTISGGSLSASTTVSASCQSLTSGVNPKGTIHWKATGVGASPTTVGFSNGSGSVNNGVITLTLPGSGGTSTATGSFAGTKSHAKVVIDQNETTLGSDCLLGGVSQLTFTGTNGASSLTVA